MTKNPLTLSPGIEIQQATHLLIEKDVSGAPVLDKHGRLVGVISRRDVMRAVGEYYPTRA